MIASKTARARGPAPRLVAIARGAPDPPRREVDLDVPHRSDGDVLNRMALWVADVSAESALAAKTPDMAAK